MATPGLASRQGQSIGLGSKRTYTKTELEELWAAENPGLGDPHLMAAIALAESAGKAYEINSIGACGLWQIHPFENGCTNPAINAKQAGQKLKTQGLGAWSTYKEGQYRAFLGGSSFTGSSSEGKRRFAFSFPWESETQKQHEEGSIPEGPKLGQKLEGVGEGIAAIGEALKFLTSAEGWLRIIKVFGGAILVLVAIIELAKIGGG
jgi:hypothetical protein